MSDLKFKEGDWVKEKNGTQGMTVIGYEGNAGQVRCQYKNAEGESVEKIFQEEELVKL